MQGHPASARPLYARGLRRITLLVPIGCAEGLLLLARELRARQRAGTAAATPAWRRLSPSAELFVDLDSGAGCAVRDTGLEIPLPALLLGRCSEGDDAADAGVQRICNALDDATFARCI